ncbi:hypothetical protein CAEBREN_06485 [Caenorhabditis brenneri]|uniref:Uncharacterized protein n=1 Tax=Caenorhabditis brenneri TaxID=135651 RepID=G0NMZ1_CAEBE|nr:hypothetical protein CAEBREN_06485 [Caenorhabditis brenneri]
MQLDAPFEEGAIALASTFVYGNNFMNLVHFIFSTSIVIVIAVSTVLVVLKLRSENMRKTSNRSKCRTKAETTLTVTTILIMIPLILAQAMTLCKKLFIRWSILTYFLSLADSIPNIFSKIVCIQLDTPFQEGAISISSTFIHGNNFMNMTHFVFSTGIIFIIVISTLLVLVKLRNENMKKTNKSLSRNKAETTLTVTTFLIIIPSLLAQGLTVSSFLNSPYFSYILSVRPLMLDLRVNVVSIYFYFTHPVFKKKNMSPGPSAMFGSSTL